MLGSADGPKLGLEVGSEEVLGSDEILGSMLGVLLGWKLRLGLSLGSIVGTVLGLLLREGVSEGLTSCSFNQAKAYSETLSSNETSKTEESLGKLNTRTLSMVLHLEFC